MYRDPLSCSASWEMCTSASLLSFYQSTGATADYLICDVHVWNQMSPKGASWPYMGAHLQSRSLFGARRACGLVFPESEDEFYKLPAQAAPYCGAVPRRKNHSYKAVHNTWVQFASLVLQCLELASSEPEGVQRPITEGQGTWSK